MIAAKAGKRRGWRGQLWRPPGHQRQRRGCCIPRKRLAARSPEQAAAFTKSIYQLRMATPPEKLAASLGAGREGTRRGREARQFSLLVAELDASHAAMASSASSLTTLRLIGDPRAVPRLIQRSRRASPPLPRPGKFPAATPTHATSSPKTRSPAPRPSTGAFPRSMPALPSATPRSNPSRITRKARDAITNGGPQRLTPSR